jgi:hypothetical protein
MPKAKVVALDDLSHADKVLIALYRASNGTTDRVPFEDIVLQAWQAFPTDFGLPKNPQFPDSSVVSKRLYSDLITKRLVISLKSRVYRLSEKGVSEAQRLLGLSTERKKVEKNSAIILNRDEEQFIESAIRSKPFSVWKTGKNEDLIDYDVRVFFRFSTGTPIKERKRRVELASDALQKATSLNMPDADELKRLFDFLLQKFPQLFQEN